MVTVTGLKSIKPRLSLRNGVIGAQVMATSLLKPVLLQRDALTTKRFYKKAYSEVLHNLDYYSTDIRCREQ